ncbi:PAS domain-containing protein [Marinimicrobium agarilyticum]|uniref:PAS domain-containing protein n=1 Tax=Marinimicrobium agarilyticum TaxID=306546 RepID=UPI00146C03AF|nr:PAS domain-containing protein [Marinimicrobium agarilyticum]
MKAQSKKIVEQLVRRQAYASALRWVILSLGILVLSLHFHELSSTAGLTAWRTEIWWRYIGEALLLLLILAAVFLGARNDRDRSRLERALENDSVLFRQLADHVGEVFWLEDALSGELLYVSPAYERVWGIARGSLDRMPRRWLDAVVPKHQERVKLEWSKRAAGGYDVEYELERPDGLRRWVRDRAFPVENHDGEVVRIVGFASDITDRRQMSEQLIQGQRLLNLATQMARLGGWSADMVSDQVTLNEEACAIFDVPFGKPLTLEQAFSFCTSSFQPQVSEAFERAIADRAPVDVEAQVVTAFGRYVWVRVQAHPIIDDRGILQRLEGAVQDVTERKHAASLLSQGVRRFREFSDAMPHLVWTADLKGQLDYGNRMLAEYLGCEREDPQLDDLWRSAIAQSDRSHYLSSWGIALKTGDRLEVELRLRRFDGQWRWHSLQAIPLKDNKNRIIKWYGSAIDIHERRRAEKEQARIRELEASRELAELASATKSEFLASMSHEVRTPINGIVGMVDVLHETSLRGEQVEMVDIIRESAQSLLGIVNDILDFSKIEAGKLELAPVPFSPAAVVRSVCLLLDRMALNQGVELTLYTDPAVPTHVMGDELRLRQVLLNLVNNAIKFSSRLDRPGRVAVRLYMTGRSETSVDLSFHVIDNGIGMTPETQSRLFNPFTQADPSTTRHYGGTGLGLSISSSLVELMGGDIKVSSEAQQGAEFRMTLRLPLVPDGSADEQRPDLSGVSCLVWPDYQGADWAAYLRAAGARVYAPLEVPEAAESDDSLWLMVRDTGLDSRFSIQTTEKLTLPVWPARYHWLLVGRGHRRRVREDGAGVYGIDSNSLSLPAFLQAAATALERESLESHAPLVEASRPDRVVLQREEALLAGRLVLVAEDNETNQRVIEQQLGLLGYVADMCRDGRAALRFWQQEARGYAMVLTDLHMPDIDGYALVAEIRRAEAERGVSQPLPVVALTANAVAGEAQRCKQLGFDDYLLKPVSLDALREALVRWIEPRGGPPEAVDGAEWARGETPVSETLNLKVLQDLIGGDEELLAEFVESFRRSSEELVGRLREAARERQWQVVADAAHSLKSSARSVGANGLADRSLALERWGRTRATGSSLIGELLNNFESEWQKVQRALAQVQAHLSDRR